MFFCPSVCVAVHVYTYRSARTYIHMCIYVCGQRNSPVDGRRVKLFNHFGAQGNFRVAPRPCSIHRNKDTKP